MPTNKDYYELLAVQRTASTQEIKSAYRKLAVQYHPDRNPGDAKAEERFKEAAEAYSVLSDADKRARYDRFGHEGLGGGFSGFDSTTFGDFSDILGDLFGFGGPRRRRGGRHPQPGADLRYELHIGLEEAAFGEKKVLQVPRLETCAACAGSGGRDGTRPSNCPTCSGAGQVRYQQGFFTIARTCPDCGGDGVSVTDPCPECSGAGRVEKEHLLEVGIPAGVDTGTRMRLTGEGEHGRFGGPAGDLYVDIVVEPHPIFGRRGADVVSEVAISYYQAVLGADIEVRTLHGDVPLEIPAGTAIGTDFRLKGKGIQRLEGRGQGDHVVLIRVEVPHPRDLDPRAVELLRQGAQIDRRPVKGERKVMDRVRGLFD
jgi:molecular chaperone DnaJ